LYVILNEQLIPTPCRNYARGQVDFNIPEARPSNG
jgi:hypothetical protein